MPEEKDGEPTPEDPKVEEQPEEKKPEEPSEKKEEKPIEVEEPPKRFPKQEQTPVEKQLGYLQRKNKELEERLQEKQLEDLSNGLEVDDEQPVTRRELQDLLEKKDKETASERMVSEFVLQNPDYKKYEPRIRKFVNDPDYANVSIGFIAKGIMADNLDEEINERARAKAEADAEAERTKSGGSSKRAIPGKKKSVWDETPEEFQQHQAEVLQRGRD